jgi:hypothetical protein
MRVLRRILAIRAAQAGCSRPGRLARSASFLTWWVSTVVRVWHHSHWPCRSRVMISFGRAGGAGWRSVMTVLRCRLSGMPPNRAASGFLPGRSSRASKQVRGPCAVAMTALCLRAVFRHRGAVFRGERLEHG